jgi:hypothetical protein
MSEESGSSQLRSSSGSSDTVAIIAIVATAVVVLACVGACALAAYAFLSNPPWGFL